MQKYIRFNKRNIALLLVLIVQLKQLKLWVGCHDLQSFFHFSKDNFSIQLLGEIHSDTGVPFWIIRLLHNKLSYSSLYSYNNYLQFFDDKFLISLMSIIGFVGFLIGVWYGLKTKNKYIKFFLLLVFVFPVFEIFLYKDIPFVLFFILLVTLYNLMSLLGFWSMMNLSGSKLPFLIIILLTLVSLLWSFVFGGNLNDFCTKSG